MMAIWAVLHIAGHLLESWVSWWYWWEIMNGEASGCKTEKMGSEGENAMQWWHNDDDDDDGKDSFGQ